MMNEETLKLFEEWVVMTRRGYSLDKDFISEDSRPYVFTETHKAYEAFCAGLRMGGAKQAEPAPEPEPFNLEKARAGEPIQHRIGSPLKFLGYDATQLLPLIVSLDGEARAYCYDGKCHGLPEFDVVMAPKPMKEYGGWINIYPSSDGRYRGMTVHDTQDDANEEAGRDRAACIYISWKEKL